MSIPLRVLNNLQKNIESHNLALEAVRQTLRDPDTPLTSFLEAKSKAVKLEMSIQAQRRKYKGNANYTGFYVKNVNNKVKFILPNGVGQRPAPNTQMWNTRTLITNYQNFEDGRYVVKYPAIEEKMFTPLAEKPKEEEAKPKPEAKPEEPKADPSVSRETLSRTEPFITQGEMPSETQKTREALQALKTAIEGTDKTKQFNAYQEVEKLSNEELLYLFGILSPAFKTANPTVSTAGVLQRHAETVSNAMKPTMLAITEVINGLNSADETARLNAFKRLVNNESLATDVFNGLSFEYRQKNSVLTLEAFINFIEVQTDILASHKVPPTKKDEPNMDKPKVEVGEAIEGGASTTQTTTATSSEPVVLDEVQMPTDRRAGGGGISGMARIQKVEGLRTGGGGVGDFGIDVDADTIPDIIDLDGDGIPDITPEGVPTQQLGARMAQEDSQRKNASIDRLKDEIRAYHLVYENNIEEFRDKDHKKAKELALKSKQIEVVRQHHKNMEYTIARYYKREPTLRLGVIVDAEEYFASLGGMGGTSASGVVDGVLTVAPPTNSLGDKLAPPKLIHNTYISGGIAVAQKQPIVNRMVRTRPQPIPSKITAPERFPKVDTFRAYTINRQTPQKPMLNIKFK